MLLSKSRYVAGLQCPKRLWHEVNARELLAPPDAAQQAIFDQGHEVGRLAQNLFPGGIEIDPARLGWRGALAATRVALARRVPLYEAAFDFAGAACRVDILVPVGDGAWDLVEVKSTTKTRDEHVADLAFQSWVVAGSGVPLARSWLCHLDPEYVRQGPLDVERLFALEDLTERIAPALAGLPAAVGLLQEVAAQPRSPEVAIGPHCSDPYECPLIPVCWRDVPDESVFTLYRGGRKPWELFAAGIVDLTAIPDATSLTAAQAIQVAAARAGQPHVDRAVLREFLSRLVHPVHYFDLESFALAIPPFDGTRPFQQIPFQFSLHVVDSPGAAPRARSFLAEGGGDPRPAFLAAGRAALGAIGAGGATGASGSIVAYNAQFERGCLDDCAAAFPEHAGWVAELGPRFVDLLEPFRAFAFYDPRQRGSASLKAVLPILAGHGYEELEIQEGGQAAREYLRSLDLATAEAERRRIRAALVDYCGRDTEGMVEIVAALARLAGGQVPAP